MQFASEEQNERHAKQSNDDTQTRSEPERHARHHTPTGHGRESPKKRADQREAGAAIQACLFERHPNAFRMIHRKKNAGEDGNSGEEVEAGREPIAEEQTGANGRNHRLDVEDDIHDRRISVLEGEGEENRSYSRAGEPGKDQKAPGPSVDPRDLAKLH